MTEVPTTPWRERPWTHAEATGHAPGHARWRRLPGVVRHTFTHFELELTVLAGRLDGAAAPPEAIWSHPRDLAAFPLPSVMKKVVTHALAGLKRG
jgi:A/G-specific adenine glycosylase